MNVIGAMMPCHNPAQNPAGMAPGSLYLELFPATQSPFAIVGKIIVLRLLRPAQLPDQRFPALDRDVIQPLQNHHVERK